jgi:hypothetical protein
VGSAEQASSAERCWLIVDERDEFLWRVSLGGSLRHWTNDPAQAKRFTEREAAELVRQWNGESVEPLRFMVVSEQTAKALSEDAGLSPSRSDDVNADTCQGIAEGAKLDGRDEGNCLVDRLRRLGWLSDEQALRLTDAEGQPRSAFDALSQLVDVAEQRALRHASSKGARAIEKAIRRRFHFEASYTADGAAIAKVLRDTYGDEAEEVAMATLTALRDAAATKSKAVRCNGSWVRGRARHRVEVLQLVLSINGKTVTISAEVKP